MWIRMNQTVSSDIGYYAKGMRYDLPESVVDKFPKGTFEKTCAPWEDNMDLIAIKQQQASAKAENILQTIAGIVKQIADLQAKLQTEISTTTALQEKVSGLKTDLDTKVDKYNALIKDPGKNAQKRANKLITEIHLLKREYQEADLQRQKHNGICIVTTAEIKLLSLTLGDKVKELKNHETEKTEKTEAAPPAEGPAGTEGNEVPEGQAVPAYQG